MSASSQGAKASLPKTDEEWQKVLAPELYRVARQKGTEPAFTGKYYQTTTPGVYRCACCGAPLFESDAKFDAGCGWPSFSKPLDEKNIQTHADDSHLMRRTEVVCSHCGAHLGHVFDDGPRPTGLRYCINSVSLNLDQKPPPGQAQETPAAPDGKKR
jgi:peptide-methionine (R)-S-oxide reductase